MNEYSVIITPDAESDLNELDDYITFTLKAPDTAIAYIISIKERLQSLCVNPERYRPVDFEPWHSKGIRKMIVRNFAVFYLILEEYNEVYIQNIIYQKRDLERIVLESTFDHDDLQTGTEAGQR